MQQQKNSFREIELSVCGFFQMTGPQLRARSAAQRFARPRYVAVHLARERTAMTLHDLKRQLGKKDHTTILHAEGMAGILLEKDPLFRKQVAAVAEILDHLAYVRTSGQSRQARIAPAAAATWC